MKTVKKYSADWYAQAEKKIRQDIHDARMIGDRWYIHQVKRERIYQSVEMAFEVLKKLSQLFGSRLGDVLPFEKFDNDLNKTINNQSK